MLSNSIRQNYINPGNDILGLLNYHYDFYSRFLKNERDILVWLPNSSQTTNKRYPVLYMHDGQNLFDPHTSFSGYDWKVDETITELAAKKLMEEIIVVGINNSKDRLAEFNLFTERGKNYASFIINELKPFIDEKYPTQPEKESTAVIGSSMGGLCSLQLFWKHQNIFGKAACLSNSFWIDDYKVFKMVREVKLSSNKFRLYLDCGDAEIEIISDNKKMNNLLKKNDLINDENYYWNIEKGAGHSEIDWAKRLNKPLTFLFNGNY